MQKRETAVIESLTGFFLISTAKMPDPRFAEQVILICEHNSYGAMGVAVNKPNPMLSMEGVLQNAGIRVPEHSLPPVYIGGPVEAEAAFLLYSSDYHTDFQLKVTPYISISRHRQVLEDIAAGRGPEKYLLIAGYAGWGPGQLEAELVNDGWLALPSSNHIIFDLPDMEKWRGAAIQHGIDIFTFGDISGCA